MAVTVKARKNEQVESLFGRFKRKLKSEKRILEILKNEFYVKPSEKKRAKFNQMKRRKQKET